MVLRLRKKQKVIDSLNRIGHYRLESIPERVVKTFEGISLITAVIVALSSPWMPQNRDIRIIRYSILLSGVVCGGSLLAKYRTPSKLEAESQRLEREREQQAREEEESRQRLERERLELYQENEAIEARVQAWADEQMRAWESQTEEIVNQHRQQWELEREMLVSQLNQVQTQLYEVTRVRTASVDSAVGWIANQVQRVLSEDFGLICSCETEPMETGSHFLVWLQPRGDKPTLKKLRELAEELPLRVKEIKAVPNIEIDGGNGAIRLEIPKKSTKPDKADLVPLYDWELAKDEAAGFIVAGNTGSAKSTVSLWLLGLLTEDESKQVIVLDVHARKNRWHEFGLPIIYEQDKVILALELILGELNRRKLTGDEYPPLVIVLDEIGALKRNCQDKDQSKWVDDALLLIGAEGRKFGICLIAINQSKNVNALGIDGQNRNNYFLVMLGAGARDYADLSWGKTNERNAFIHSQAYPCLVTGCVSTQVAKHPTHGEYKRYRMKGMKPKNLKPINWLNPDINGLGELVASGDKFITPPNPTASPPMAETLTPLNPTVPTNGSGRNQPTPENEVLPLPPMATDEVRERILDCKAKGMNQEQTIKELWGLSKDGKNQNWLACRDIYKEVLE